MDIAERFAEINEAYRVLSDDAHSIRSSRLGEVEIHLSTREGYNERGRLVALRVRRVRRGIGP